MVQEKIDYNNLTIEDVIRFVEIIDWKKVPINIILTNKVVEFADDFPGIKNRILDFFSSIETKVDGYNTMILIKKILDKGLDPNWGNCYLLKIASYYGHTETVKLLLEHGADVHVGNDYCLKHSCANGHFETVKILAEHGADVHVYGEYPLLISCRNGYYQTVKTLIEAGADVHVNNDHPIKLALIGGNKEIVNLLKEYGAKTN